jgi:hypothetical protein
MGGAFVLAFASGTCIGLKHRVALQVIEVVFIVQWIVFLLFPLGLLADLSTLMGWFSIVFVLALKFFADESLQSYFWRRLDQVSPVGHRDAIQRTVIWLWTLANGVGRLLAPIIFTLIHQISFDNVCLALGLVYLLGGSILVVVFLQLRVDKALSCFRARSQDRRSIETV